MKFFSTIYVIIGVAAFGPAAVDNGSALGGVAGAIWWPLYLSWAVAERVVHP